MDSLEEEGDKDDEDEEDEDGEDEEDEEDKKDEVEAVMHRDGNIACKRVRTEYVRTAKVANNVC